MIRWDRWVCEFCYRLYYGNHLPPDWDVVLQSLVCPSCQSRIKEIPGGYSVVKGGAFSDGHDPRREAR